MIRFGSPRNPLHSRTGSNELPCDRQTLRLLPLFLRGREDRCATSCQKWFLFKGRIGRRRYWSLTLLYMFAFMVGLAMLIALGIMLGAGPTDAITVVRASIRIVFVVSMSVAIAGIGVRRLHDRGKTVMQRSIGAAACLASTRVRVSGLQRSRPGSYAVRQSLCCLAPFDCLPSLPS